MIIFLFKGEYSLMLITHSHNCSFVAVTRAVIQSSDYHPSENDDVQAVLSLYQQAYRSIFRSHYSPLI